jgi:hypothetical protein
MLFYFQYYLNNILLRKHFVFFQFCFNVKHRITKPLLNIFLHFFSFFFFPNFLSKMAILIFYNQFYKKNFLLSYHNKFIFIPFLFIFSKFSRIRGYSKIVLFLQKSKIII